MCVWCLWDFCRWIKWNQDADLQEICQDDMLSALSKRWKKTWYPQRKHKKTWYTKSQSLSRHVTGIGGVRSRPESSRWDGGGTVGRTVGPWKLPLSAVKVSKVGRFGRKWWCRSSLCRADRWRRSFRCRSSHWCVEERMRAGALAKDRILCVDLPGHHSQSFQCIFSSLGVSGRLYWRSRSLTRYIYQIYIYI